MSKRVDWKLVAAGSVLAGLVVCVFAAERLEAGLTMAERLDAVRTLAPRDTDGVNSLALGIGWTIVALIGGICGAAVTHVMALQVPVGDRARVRRLGGYATLAWVAAQAVGVVSLAWGRDLSPVRLVLLLVATGLAVGALALAGSHVVGGLRTAWRRASIVRVQLLLLAALFVLVCVAPVTSDQMREVLRGWTDSPLHVVYGVAAALLLGAVCRASAVRLLQPGPGSAGDSGVSVRVRAAVAVGGLLAGVLLGVLAGLWILGSLVALVAVIAALTEADDPIQDADASPTALRRLAATLGVVPLGVLLAGLVTAAVDSILLPAPGWFGLTAVTLGVTVAFAILCARADTFAGDRERIHWGLYAGSAAAAVLFATVAPTAGGPVLLVVAGAVAVHPRGGSSAGELWAGSLAAAGLAVAVYLDPIEAPRVAGTFAVALTGVTGVLAFLHGIAAVAARRAPLTSWTPDRVPVVTLLAVWVAGAWWVATDADSRLHQARTVERSAAERLVLDEAVPRWLGARSTLPGKRRRVLPMLLVAASGGGAKAAFWTDAVLDCALADERPPPEATECPAPAVPAGRRLEYLFLTSSVSGGSVGVRHLLASRGSIGRGAEWVNRTAGREVLSPAVAWGLFHDLPAFLLGLPLDPARCAGAGTCPLHADRALVQEAAVAAFRAELDPPPAGGLLDSGPGDIYPVFNATVDGARARLLLSRLELAPRRHPGPDCAAQRTPRQPAAGALDAHDILPGDRDVPIVTAAVLSARFPVVVPGGTIGAARPRRGCSIGTVPAVRVRDGGYMENSGVLTITDLLPAILEAVEQWEESHESVDVRPMVVSIDDDAAALDEDETLTENDVLPGRRYPALGIATTAGPGYLTLLGRGALEACLFGEVAYVRISPPLRVGAHATTGWDVSRAARDADLLKALREDGPAASGVAAVRDHLAGVDVSACG